ncbi:MAG TPA: hypothetical protein PKM88_00680 [bacterium]|nr:hypothetical protein [bacterium]
MSPESAPAGAGTPATVFGRQAFTAGAGLVIGNPFLEMLLRRHTGINAGARLYHFLQSPASRRRLFLAVVGYYAIVVLIAAVAMIAAFDAGADLLSSFTPPLMLVLVLPFMLVAMGETLLIILLPVLAVSSMVSSRRNNRLSLALITLLTPRQILAGLYLSRTLLLWAVVAIILPFVSGNLPFTFFLNAGSDYPSVLSLLLMIPLALVGSAIWLGARLVDTLVALAVSLRCRTVGSALAATFGALVVVWIVRMAVRFALHGVLMLLQLQGQSPDATSSFAAHAFSQNGMLLTDPVALAVTAVPVWLLWRRTERAYCAAPENHL